MFFPFLDIPFNKSMGVEYFVDFFFVEDSLVDLCAFISLKEIVGAHLILFLCCNMGVTSLRLIIDIPSNNNMPRFFRYGGFNPCLMQCFDHFDIEMLIFARNPFLF